MRILHTADWHLGKIVNEYSMLELQEEYLNHLIQEIKNQDIDVVLMAGDLYDRAIPPKEAVSLVNNFFTKVTQHLKVPVLMIGGNHDSQERIEYGADLLAASDLFIEGTTKNVIRKVEIKDTNFYLLPYDDHRNVRSILNNDSIKTPEDALRAQLELIKDSWDEDAVNILIYHHFIINSKVDEDIEESDSERPLNIGTLEYIPVELIEHFDYVALGHLHKAQKVKYDHIRYSGSPLKYSKSEANHRKQNLIIDITKENIKIKPLEVKVSKDLRVVRGLFEEIIKESSNDFIFFELEDESYVLDAMNRLRKNYPYTMGLEYINQQIVEKHKVFHAEEDIKKDNLEDLFADFYEQNTGLPMNEKQKDRVIQTLEEVQKQEDA